MRAIWGRVSIGAYVGVCRVQVFRVCEYPYYVR